MIAAAERGKTPAQYVALHDAKFGARWLLNAPLRLSAASKLLATPKETAALHGGDGGADDTVAAATTVPPPARYVLTGGGPGVGQLAYSGCHGEFIDFSDKQYETTHWCRVRLLTVPAGSALSVGDEMKWARTALRELLPNGELATKAPTREQLLRSAAPWSTAPATATAAQLHRLAAAARAIISDATSSRPNFERYAGAALHACATVIAVVGPAIDRGMS